MNAYLTEPRWFERATGFSDAGDGPLVAARPRSPTSRPSTASPRRCRSTPAASASWPGITSRPRATWACRSSASACCTGTATSPSRCPPTAGRPSATRPTTRTGCRSTLLRDAGGRAGPGQRGAGRRPRAGRPDLGGPGRPGAAAAARLLRGGERARAAARSPTGCTAGAASTGSGRNCCSASAASARCARSARSPATRSPRCSTPTRGTPASSASSASASTSPQGSAFDEALELCRAGTVFTTHTPVPGRASTGSRRDLIERYFSHGRRRPGAAGGPGARAWRRDLPGRRPARVQHGRHGHAAGAAGQRRSASCTAQVSREMFAGLWPGFDTAEVPIGSITNGVHAPTWVAPRDTGAGQTRVRRR